MIKSTPSKIGDKVNQKKIGAGLMALAFPVIALSISVGSANAASVESTVEAMDACQWQIAGVPSTIDMTAETKYYGDALSVTGSTAEPLILGLSGAAAPETATSGSSTDCSFYNDKATADVDIDMTSTGTSVGAFYGEGAGTEDTSLSFEIDGANPFTINAVSACSTEFVTGESFPLDGTPPPSSLVNAPSEGLVNVYNAETDLRCSIALSYSLTIPATDEVPAAPGENYTFRGGEVEFVFDTTLDSQLP
jgi:hypothetical protein